MTYPSDLVSRDELAIYCLKLANDTLDGLWLKIRDQVLEEVYNTISHYSLRYGALSISDDGSKMILKVCDTLKMNYVDSDILEGLTQRLHAEILSESVGYRLDSHNHISWAHYAQ